MPLVFSYKFIPTSSFSKKKINIYLFRKFLCWGSPRPDPGLGVCGEHSQDPACCHTEISYSEKIQSRINKAKRHMSQILGETKQKLSRVSPRKSHRTCLTSPTLEYDTMCENVVRDSVLRGFLQVWSHGHPLPSLHQNSRLPEERCLA